MVSVKEEKFVKRNVMKEWIRKNAFSCCKDEDEIIYVYKFPIIKYKKYTTIEGVIYLDPQTGDVSISVYDVPNRCDYEPFFHNDYGNYSVILEKINKSFLKEFKKLGIELEDKDEQ